ncbi:hypothetical protein KEHDKFFH_09420 [Marinobacter maroccanus]|uniref:Uncharacterized protein n=1 Tax=Marinobacter maroccanus TaxID=2055143 RepID=A0A2S5ZAS6_9GAMM|nr:hypothetical protein [Marinobacter maroccanus]PPI84483.1 hypothetical protein KEHDKFFH_09420 [Marinobacter maroccanus]
MSLERQSRKVALFFSAGLILIFLGLYLDGRDRIFTLDAVTETASVVTSDGAFSEWRVGGANLHKSPFATKDSAILLPESAYLLIHQGTRVDIQRHGIQDVRLTLSRTEKSVGSIVSPDDVDRLLGNWASLTVSSDDRPFVWPFRGTLVVGDDVSSGVDSVLLQGTVNVLEEQLVRDTRYSAGTSELDRGDKVGFWKQPEGEKHEEAIVEGFFRIEPTNQERFTEALNAIQLVAHGSADHVKVERLGSSGYQIRATNWARFLYDPLLSFFAGLGALFFAAIEIYSNVREILRDVASRD